MLDPDGDGLRADFLDLFSRGADADLPDPDFDRLAARVFDYNVRHVPAYAAFCRARGAQPGDIGSWLDIPAVPTAAFKELTLLADGARAETVFRTSGTTRGIERRGAHHVADLSLYRGSLRAAFRAFLLPDHARLRFLSLMPPASALPESSLAFMIDDVRAEFGAPGSAAFADSAGVDFDGLDRAVQDAGEAGMGVLLLGTSSSFIHWLDRLTARGRVHALPPESRLMDTGGYKGAGRRVEPEWLRAAYHERLGLPGHAVINEYGMTEMLSQLYDTGLRDHLAGRPVRGRKQGPPWVRSAAVDPETLEPLPPGETGILRHLDLANVGSVAAIQTEDLGAVDDHGVRLDGRAPGAPPRGCSIAMDLLLGAPE
jgi:hypothetical protein